MASDPFRIRDHVADFDDIVADIRTRSETARAGLAVALAANPPILIADEPTAEVDADTELRLIDHFETRRRAGLTTLLATHSPALARKAGRIIRLHDGRVEND